jgi:large subunit ribosomal protein L9
VPAASRQRDRATRTASITSALIERVAKERPGQEVAANQRLTLRFSVVGEDEKLFGSVTSRDIGDQLKKAGIEIDHRWVQLDAPVKALGKYETVVRLAAGVTAALKFWVVGKDK